MWREPYLPGSVIYVLHQIHPCLCLSVVFFIFSVEPCLYDLCVCVYTYMCVCVYTYMCVCVHIHVCVCVCVCVCVLHSSLYSPLPGCLSVVYIILTPAQLPECGVQMAGEPVSSSLQSHPETLCLSAVRKSFFYPESASQHSLPSTQWRKCTLRLKLYMGKAWWTANPGSAFPIVHVQCAEAAFSC